MASHQGRNRRHLAARRGIDLQARRDRSLLRATRLAEGMRREIVTVPLDADLERLRTMFRHRHLPVFVVDQQGQLYGSISFEDFADAALEPEREKPPTARDLVHRIPRRCCPRTTSRPRSAYAR